MNLYLFSRVNPITPGNKIATLQLMFVLIEAGKYENKLVK